MHTEVAAEASTFVYNTSATLIFIVMAITFLFPCNIVFPLDRRTMSLLCATLVYITRTLAFRDEKFIIVDVIDFDVLVLLASIMCINHIVVNQIETTRVIKQLQDTIKLTPLKGLWMVSLAAFLASPFLTNDGVCLLFVQPICAAFDFSLGDNGSNHASINGGNENEENNRKQPLEDQPLVNSNLENNAKDEQVQGYGNQSQHINGELEEKPESPWPPQSLRSNDVIYYMLALACASNIGSALTYTGNPQNMVLAADAVKVLSPIKFLAYMLLPSIAAFFITIYFIQYSWKKQRIADYAEQVEAYHLNEIINPALNLSKIESCVISQEDNNCASKANSVSFERELEMKGGERRSLAGDYDIEGRPERYDPASFGRLSISGNTDNNSQYSPNDNKRDNRLAITDGNSSPSQSFKSPSRSAHSPVDPNTIRVVSSPLPYVVLIMLAVMVIMIFVDVISISGLVSISALSMVLVVVVGNHWRGRPILVSNHAAAQEGFQQVSDEEKMTSLNDFFEELFASIDYSLLIIFLGTFIVVANLDSTGIPKFLWDKIVGDIPFKTVGSVLGISCFVLVASQLLGNVAVVQMAKPNVEALDDNSKRFAWAVISFVATVGGNLTITGSAANIIVAEKCHKIAPSCKFDFFRHYKVCFWITLLSCFVGGVMISIICYLEDQSAESR